MNYNNLVRSLIWRVPLRSVATGSRHLGVSTRTNRQFLRPHPSPYLHFSTSARTYSTQPIVSVNKDGSNSGVRNPRPEYEMTFTCTPCGTRSRHRMSKQAYHNGSVLITCPRCKNKHVISDNLNIFGDTAMTIEELMREKGQIVKKGSLSEDGSLEFWADGTTTERNSDIMEDDKS